MDSALQRTLRGLLLALFPLVLLVVLYRTYEPSEIKTLIFVATVSLLALGWLQLTMEQEALRVERSLLHLALAVNVVVWLTSLLLSPYPNEGLGPISERLAGVALILLAPCFLVRRRDLRLAVGLLVLAAALMSLYGILQFFRLDPFLDTDGLVGHFRVNSTTNHPNVFISVLAAVVPLNLVAFRLVGRGALRWALVGALLLNLSAAVATLSRAGWAATAFSTLATLVGLYLVRGKRARSTETSRGRSLMLVMVLVPVLVALVAGLMLSRGNLDPGERNRLLDLRGPTVARRLLIYRAALRMAREHPLMGQGLGSFSLLLPGYRSPELARYFPRNEFHVEHAVSEPLEVLAESGGIGLLGWLLLVVALGIRPLIVARRCDDPELRAILVGCGVGTLGLVAHGLMEVNLRFQPPLFLFFALPALALVAERLGRARAPRPLGEVRGWPARLAISGSVGLAFGLLFAMTLSNYVADWYVTSGRRALARGDDGTAERELSRALGAWSGNLPARYRLAYTLWRLGHLDAAAREYREVIRRSPYYFDVNHDLARVLTEQGKTQQAQPFVDTAVRINPYHVPSHELAVELALAAGKVKRARELADHIVEVAGHDPVAHLALARVRLAEGQREAALRQLEQALKLDRTNKAVRHLRQQVLDRKGH